MPRSESGARRSRRRLVQLAWVLGWLACGETPAAGAGAEPAAIGRLSAGGHESFASLSHTCAVVDASLQCWGAAERGQTGDASFARRRPLPVRVPGLDDVRAVAAGGTHTCAIAGPRVLCFGNNDHGQSGGDRPFVRLQPAPVEGLPDGATAIAAGLHHSCAVVTGDVYCWGRNEQGEAGVPARPDCREPFRVQRCSVSPTRVTGVEAAQALALGDRHACALTPAGVWCWGAGRSEPRRIEGLTTRVRGLAAGADHSCALAGDRVSCWAADADRARPVEGLPAGVALSFLAAGGDRTCAASADAAWCWRRGEGAAAAIAAVEGLDGPLHALAVGRDHACAQQGDRVLCWGDDDAGQLGRGVGLRRDPRAAPVADWDRGQWRDANGDGRITLVCLGDSNTQAMAGAEPPWCDRLAPLLGDEVRVVNRGIGGATAGPSLVEAASVLAYVLENDAPDLAVLAYGTNDVLAGHAIEDVVASLARLDRALLAAGARSWIALVPPMRSGDAHAAQGAALNDALRGIFPEERRIDFASGLTDADLLDRVHLGGAAQQRLAERAALAIGRRRPGNAR